MPSVPPNMNSSARHINDVAAVTPNSIALLADVTDFRSGTLQIGAAAGQSLPTAGAVQVEGTLDDVNWFTVPTYPVTSVSGSTGVLSLLAQNAVIFHCDYARLRVRNTVAVVGSPILPYITLLLHENEMIGIGGALAAGAAASVGSAAHSSPSVSSPVRVAGRVNIASDLTLAAGDVSDLFMTSGGALVTQPFSAPELFWGLTGIKTDATPLVKALAGATLRNYCTDIQLQNSSATATVFQVLDGATVLWSCNLPAAMPVPVSVNFSTPLRGSVNAVLNYQCITSGTNTFINAQGFIAP
jgi:hypothetical protein